MKALEYIDKKIAEADAEVARAGATQAVAVQLVEAGRDHGRERLHALYYAAHANQRTATPEYASALKEKWIERVLDAAGESIRTAALAATQPSAAPGDGQGAAPEGWKLVPINLTEGMLIAASEDYNHDLVQNVWATLLSAAPSTATAAREQEVPDGSTPGLWRVEKRERDGEMVMCWVAAPDCNGFAYAAEILGDDEYRDGEEATAEGMSRRLADCELIVKAVNAYRATLASRPEAPAAPSAEVVHVEAVATVVARADGLELDWLGEGGIAALTEGVTLYIADHPITDDNGAGTVLRA